MEDDETLLHQEWQPDSTFIVTQSPNDQWVMIEDGTKIFCGVNLESRAAMWVRGGELVETNMQVSLEPWWGVVGPVRRVILSL